MWAHMSASSAMALDACHTPTAADAKPHHPCTAVAADGHVAKRAIILTMYLFTTAGGVAPDHLGITAAAANRGLTLG